MIILFSRNHKLEHFLSPTAELRISEAAFGSRTTYSCSSVSFPVNSACHLLNSIRLLPQATSDSHEQAAQRSFAFMSYNASSRVILNSHSFTNRIGIAHLSDVCVDAVSLPFTSVFEEEV